MAAIALFCGLSLVSRSAQAQLPQVEITGAGADLERNIRGLLNLPNAACDSSLRRLNRFLPQLHQDVTRASRALGYYYLQQDIQFSAAEECWSLRINVVPGEPVRIGNIDISVVDQPLFDSVLETLPVKEGDQLNHAHYEQIKNALSAMAVENGFFAARFNNSQLLLDLEQNLATIQIDFVPGPRYNFGALEIAPVEVLADDFIRRFIQLEPGTPYSSAALIDLRNTLNGSQYFSDVLVTPQLEREVNQQIPIRVALQPRPRRVYGAGIGATTDTGPRVRLDYADRYLNPRGHHISIQGSAALLEQSFDANYTVPMWEPATQSLRFSGGILNENNATYDAQVLKLGVSYSQINRFNFRENYFVNFQHDEYTLNELNEVSDLLIAGTNVSRTVADDAIFPQRGWRVFGQVRGASEALFSSSSFAQLYLSGKLVHAIGPGRLLFKFEAAATMVDELKEIPLSVQFFAGGDQSVRGYRYESLGPLNDDGEVIGGKHLLTLGMEYDFNIRANWKAAAFIDAGNAFNTVNEMKLSKGAGVGLRWLSPIGPVRFDLASALDEDGKLRLHITMGPDL